MTEQALLLERVLRNNDIASLEDKDLHTQLAAYINNLILHHFDELISVLYRVDVNEQKLKSLLKENRDTDAGAMIAALIIERQLQKIRSRQDHRQDNNIDEEEKW